MPYNVVGIDQSLTETGYVVIPDTGAYASGVIKPKMYGVDRLIYIENILNTLIDAQTSLVVMEGYAFNPRAGQAFSLGELGGVIKRMVRLRGVPLISVAPGTLKKYVTGDGNAKKNVMLLETFKRFGETFTNDNICDAYCLAKLGHEYLSAARGSSCPSTFRAIYKAVCKYNELI